MLEAILWGVVQGLTEFLPISSSGHLVLVPAFLGVEPPDLATSAVLHLGTLLAVVGYYRKDLLKLVRFPTDQEARRVLILLIIGTVPAVIGLVVEDQVSSFQENVTAVAWALIFTGVVLWLWGLIPKRSGRLEDAGPLDAVLVGLAQALALIPGISRSGLTITAGAARGLSPIEAARYSFLLGVPAIAGAGLIQGLQLADEGGLEQTVWVGVAVAAVVGYAAIAFLVRGLARFGLTPYAAYCTAVGVVALIVL